MGAGNLDPEQACKKEASVSWGSTPLISRCRLGEANFLHAPRAVETEKDVVPMSTSSEEAFELHLSATALLDKHWETQEEAFNTGTRKPPTTWPNALVRSILANRRS